MATLELKQIRKTYPKAEQETLKGIDISIDSGEFLILVGPSGCGKSTLMNTIAGLEGISSGEIVIDGRDVSVVEPKDRDIAMVFQSYALYPNMTVRVNIAFGLKIRKLPDAEIDAEVQRVAEMLQIDHLLDRKPSQLSGGQRQRVALGRCFVQPHAIWLLDEPFSALDPILREEMLRLVAKLAKERNITVLMVTHHISDARAIGSNFIFVANGQVEAAGEISQLSSTHANQSLSEFVRAGE